MEFRFNKSGICLNPVIKVSLEKGPQHIIIGVAQTPGGEWSNSLDYRVDTCGGGYGACLRETSRGLFPNEREAVCSALEYMKSVIQREIKDIAGRREMDDYGRVVNTSKRLSELKWFLARVEDKLEFFDPVQMTLF